MTVFTIVPQLGLVTNGCAIVTTLYNLITTFEVGDILFLRNQANLKGKLEKIVVKKINVLNDGSEVYIDTYNSKHLASKLVIESMAEALVEAYDERIAELTELLDE